jgi:hypothetical protein
MEISGKLTLEEAIAARRLILTTLERITRFGLGELPACMSILLGLSVPIQDHSVRGVLIGLLLSFLGALWWRFAHRRLVESDLKKFVAALPERYVLSASGIEAHFANGIKVSGPWSNLATWQESGPFLFLGATGNKPEIVLPLAGLTEAERVSLLALVAARLQLASEHRCSLLKLSS